MRWVFLASCPYLAPPVCPVKHRQSYKEHLSPFAYFSCRKEIKTELCTLQNGRQLQTFSFSSCRCVCPPNVTGLHCSSPLYSTPITSSIYNVTWEEVVGIIGAVLFLCFLVLLFVMYRRFRVKRSRERANNINNETRKDIMLNSARPNDNDFKRGSKLSNLEVSQVQIYHK